ncbi:isochorismatase family protein [Dactylosporangium sp. NPDC005572]|uniref:isochorismatase family protein n=1 Tax=Dactylosporangium sp. NPDC005572 TaxID=3156889 RepID=UPI0033A4970D
MLPRITPYPVPTGFGLARSKVDWRPDPARAALLVHDMQRYFLAPFGTADRALLARVVDNIAVLRKHAHELGMPVVYSAQPGGQGRAERGLLQDFWGDGPPPDPQALAIVEALTPGPHDVLLTKRRYSAFVGTPLASILGDRDQLIVTGVYAHIGVLATTLDAFMRDLQPFVVADAVADFSPAHHRDALRHVADRCGVVATAAEVTECLLAADAGRP